jgi:hypothetical protein
LVQSSRGGRRKLEGRAEALAGLFNAQGVANTLWSYATMGRAPGTGVMRELEGRAEAVAGYNVPRAGRGKHAMGGVSFFHLSRPYGSVDGFIRRCGDWCPWTSLGA